MKVDPGWYLDPTGAFPQRFWDGDRWTDRVVDASGIEQVSSMAPTGPRLDIDRADTPDDSQRAPGVASRPGLDAPDAWAEMPVTATTRDDTSRSPSTEIGDFGAAVTGATTLEAESGGDATRRPRRGRRRHAAAEGSDGHSTGGIGSATADIASRDASGGTDAFAVAATSMRHASVALSSVAIVVAAVPLLGPVSVALGLTAFVFALVARRRLLASSADGASGWLLAVGLAVLAALVGAVATAVLVVTFMAGGVAEWSSCVAFDDAPARCVVEFSRDAWMLVR
ncbi:MAG: DUF2510 domain-containing protein [Nitriliruptoraceae bacterium]